MNIASLNWNAVLPEVAVIATALLVLVAEIVLSRAMQDARKRKGVLAVITLLGLVTAAVLTLLSMMQPVSELQGMLRSDNLSRNLNLIVLLAGFLGVFLAWEYLDRFTHMYSEFYVLLLLAVAGMMLLGSSVELITLFVSLEILSIALYILTGFHRGQLASAEASLKYFLLGAFASGFVVYGAALLYGDTGSTRLAEIASHSTGGFYALAGLALLLVGLSFKIAVVPFHMWTPDAYQGAPTPVTAFMSVGTKAAALVALFRILQAGLGAPYEMWSWAIAVLAVLTMTIGNLAALRQTSIKRMLAYSSIAQAGYMLIGVTAGTVAGFAAVLYYLFVYAFMNLGAFAVAALLEGNKASDEQDSSMSNAQGLFYRQPLLAVAMAVFMFSLAGIPPLAGFFGKLYIFGAAVDSGWTWLAVIGAVNSVISAYYYLRIVVFMFMKEPTAESRVRLPLPDSASLVIAISVLGTLLIGIFVSPWFQTLSGAVVALGG
ncbi:MAG: NADH-quinone oxidoreductase subunit N [Caldilineales bacterium]|nr:NADH-quinone oxidoreductase subunit N [Caldilineales bacterium]